MTVAKRMEELRKMDVEHIDAAARYFNIDIEDYDCGYDYIEAIAKASIEETIRDCMRDCI